MNLENLVYADQIRSTARDILSDREYDIFESNLIYGISFKKLGDEYNVSPARIGQILAKSIRKTLEKMK